MKVLQLIKGLGLGGAERHVVDLSIGLRDRGNEVRVAYLLPNKNALVSEIEEADIAVSCLGGKFGLGFDGLIRLSKLLREFRPDIVHAHLPVAALLARILKPIFGYRLVVTEHNLFPRYHWAVKLAHRLTQRLDDVVVSCSTGVAQALPWASFVVENGLAIEPSSGVAGTDQLRRRFSIPAESVVFICVANLLLKKNHEMLVSAFAEAFRSASAAMRDSHLVLVGQDGTEREALGQRVKELSLEGVVHFFGPHPRASNLLCEANVFCLSSDFEGLPIALLEAMANGLPSIVTAVGGMPSVVIDGISGYVVPKGDRAAFARALVLMASDAEQRSRMGDAAKARLIERYSLDAMVNAVVEIYSSARG